MTNCSENYLQNTNRIHHQDHTLKVSRKSKMNVDFSHNTYRVSAGEVAFNILFPLKNVLEAQTGGAKRINFQNFIPLALNCREVGTTHT